MDIEPGSFTLGFLVGAAVTWLLGLIAGRITKNRGASKRSGQKASVTVKAEKSPSEIMADAATASVRIVGWSIVLVVILFGVGYFLFWVNGG